MSGFKLFEKSFPGGDQPLGLTVHSVPSLEQSLGGDARRRISGRWKMVLVMLVCAAPVIASYFTYYMVRPEGRRNFGELIDPQRTAPDAPAIALDGSVVNLRGLKGQWSLLSVAGGSCDTVCEHNLYLQRQLREGLGKDKDRVDWVWLVSDEAPLPVALLPGLKTATVLRLPAADIARWLAPAAGHSLSDHLYVIDPMGNWMMRFPAQLRNEDAPKAKRDIERLLRASASWDQPGREARP